VVALGDPVPGTSVVVGDFAPFPWPARPARRSAAGR